MGKRHKMLIRLDKVQETTVIVVFFYLYSFLGVGYRWSPDGLISSISQAVSSQSIYFASPKSRLFHSWESQASVWEWMYVRRKTDEM